MKQVKNFFFTLSLFLIFIPNAHSSQKELFRTRTIRSLTADKIQKLIESKTPFNAKNFNGDSLAMLIAKYNASPEVINLLLQKGDINFQIRNRNGKNFAHCVFKNPNVSVVESFMEYAVSNNLDLSSVDNNGEGVMFAFVRNHSLEDLERVTAKARKLKIKFSNSRTEKGDGILEHLMNVGKRDQYRHVQGVYDKIFQ